MTTLLMIIGGAAGGILGWLFDRAVKRNRAESSIQAEDNRETGT